MYLKYFGLTERPFSIAPDPQYLYMSARHKEAMAHLSYGLTQGGCFIVLTGEVGTGKTTLCRNLLTDLPDNADVALILNAAINEQELLQTICDELKIGYAADDSQKRLLDHINAHLLATFADNRHTVLIIDEAQLLSRDVLEKIRLLTNLETTKSKLLQIILIGQPELNDLLSRNDLRQLAQRVTARYHLGPLEKKEIGDYVNFRLSVAGCKQPLFSRQALNKLYHLTAGIPRKINVLADHSLLAAYSKTQLLVDSKCVKESANEVFIPSESAASSQWSQRRWLSIAATLVVLNIALWWWFQGGETATSTAGNGSAQTEITNSTPAVQLEAEQTVEQEGGEDNAPSVQNPADTAIATESAENAELTTILRSDEIQPGTVVISEEFLDDEPVEPLEQQAEPLQQDQATVSVALTPTPAVPRYNPDTNFGAVLDTSADITGRTAAFRNLGQAWDVTLPEVLIKPACEELEVQGVRCLTIGSWEQLLRFNRPSILVLQQRDQLHRVIVFRIEGEQVQVLVGENVHTVSAEELQARWTRNAITFWRPGEVGNSFLQQGDTSPRLPVLRQHLNRALSSSELPVLQDIESVEFDLDLAQKAFALQTRFGIVADSKIGNETYLLMNELVSPDATPVLQQRRP